jgi:hypothetical protein
MMVRREICDQSSRMGGVKDLWRSLDNLLISNFDVSS